MKLKERPSVSETVGSARAAPPPSGRVVDGGAGEQRDTALARSRQLAGLIGPTLIVLTTSEATNLQIWKTNLAPVTYLNGLILFVAGLSIVRAHNRWTRAWPVTVTLLGWVVLLGGVFRMFAPEARQGGEDAPTFAVLAGGLAMGVFLTFKAYWPKERVR